MEIRPYQKNQFVLTAVLTLLVSGFLAYLVFNNAWIAEDAYINFRSLEQFAHGNGFRWNIYERVQVFTSPLWFLLQAPLVFISANYFVNAIVLSALLQFAFWYLVWRLSGRNIFMLITAVALAAGSNSFIDYSTSGLENPLVHVLLVAMYGFYQLCYVDNDKNEERFLTAFLLSCALLIFARHDMATLAILPFLHICFRKRRQLDRLAINCLLCGMPILLWSLFAIFYYGSIIPNTAYAKLNIGAEAGEIYSRGLNYLYICYVSDPLTSLVIVTAFICGLFSIRQRVFSISLALNIFYVLAVGGDYMLGRFLSPAFALSIVVLVNFIFSLKAFTPDRSLLLAAVLSSLVVIYVTNFNYSVYNQPWNSGKKFHPGGLSDERLNSSRTMSLRAFLHRKILKSGAQNDNPWCVNNERRFRKSNSVFVSMGAIGMQGYCGGINQIIVDPHALSDPLLSRLPKAKTAFWITGHIRRDLPEGYVESLKTGENLIKDPKIAKLYGDVKLATQSDYLFSLERFRAIWRLNTGFHEVSSVRHSKLPAKKSKS